MQVPSIDPKNIVFAHMSKKELDILSRAQGGPEWNEYVNCPQLFRLGEMIKMPKIRKAIEIAAEGFKKTPRNERDDVERDLDEYQNKQFGPIERIPSSSRDENSILKTIQSYGRGHDKEIVAMPESLFNFLAQLGEGFDVNPETGLPEFGFWSGLLSVVGGIAGSFIPGVGTAIGSAIGSGLGSLGGSYIDTWNTPEKEKPSFGERAINAGLAAGAGYLGGKAWDAWNDKTPPVSELYDQFMKDKNPEKLAEMLQTHNPDMAELFKDSKSGVLEALMQDKNSGLLKNLLKDKRPTWWDTAKSMLPYASAGLMAKGHFEEERQQQQHQEDKRKNPSEYQRWHDQFKRPLRGWDNIGDETYQSGSSQQRRPKGGLSLNDIIERGDIERRRLAESLKTKPTRRLLGDDSQFKAFKKGGYVKGERTKIRNMPAIMSSTYLNGHEKGQEDNIYVDVPHGSYVIDARTISDLGDGNSEAGGKLFMEFINARPSAQINHRSTPMVQCALAAGETVVTPDKVKSFGNGSLQRGTKIFRDFVKEVRISKQSSINGIPPKALPIDTYFKNAFKAINKKKGE